MRRTKRFSDAADDTAYQRIKRFFDAADYFTYRLFLFLGAVLILWRTLG